MQHRIYASLLAELLPAPSIESDMARVHVRGTASLPLLDTCLNRGEDQGNARELALLDMTTHTARSNASLHMHMTFMYT